LFLNTTPHQYYFSDIFFGTRQKHSSRLWKVASEEKEPVIQLLYENTDESSTVRCIDVHPLASSNGEYCELRSGKLTSFKEGFVWRLLILNFKSQFHPSFIAEN